MSETTRLSPSERHRTAGSPVDPADADAPELARAEPETPAEQVGDVATPVQVSTGRHVSAAGADYARAKIGHVLDRAPGAVLAARVRLTGHGDHAVAARVLAQANADVAGRPVRHKAFTLATQSCAGTAQDMAAMDYDFQLFVEAGSGIDSVLYRTADDGYRLAQVDPRPGAVAGDLPACTISPVPTPVLSAEEAATRLELDERPFLFYRDRALRRGCVLYHRYDGHYGLITPAA